VGFGQRSLQLQEVNNTDQKPQLVHMGYVSGVQGVSGWIRVFSHSEPREQIVTYSPWQLRNEANEEQSCEVITGRRQGKTVVARLAGIEDRDTAATLVGQQIYIDRQQFTAAKEGQYYWADLIGLQVVTDKGIQLGVVENLLETGAHDVLIIEGERRRLVPFVMGDVVRSVDDERIVIDWDPEN